MSNITVVATTLLAAVQESEGFEATMLSEDKLYVVLAVVLVIWFGIVAMLYRNDRKIAALEKRLLEEGNEN
jgi:hypothetical protein